MYHATYVTTQTAATAAGTTPQNTASVATPTALRLSESSSTVRGEARPLGSGRSAVRGIRASRSRSCHWLVALAPAAASAVPTRQPNADRNSSGSVHEPPSAANANPTIDVIVTNRVIRGLVVSSSVARERSPARRASMGTATELA